MKSFLTNLLAYFYGVVEFFFEKKEDKPSWLFNGEEERNPIDQYEEK